MKSLLSFQVAPLISSDSDSLVLNIASIAIEDMRFPSTSHVHWPSDEQVKECCYCLDRCLHSRKYVIGIEKVTLGPKVWYWSTAATTRHGQHRTTSLSEVYNLTRSLGVRQAAPFSYLLRRAATVSKKYNALCGI